MRRTLAALALAATACAGLRFENEPTLTSGRLQFRLPSTGWTSGPIEASRDVVLVLEVPGGDSVGGLAVEMELVVVAISTHSVHLLFHPMDALAWPAPASALRYDLGAGWTPTPWSNADGEGLEVRFVGADPNGAGATRRVEDE